MAEGNPREKPLQETVVRPEGKPLVIEEKGNKFWTWICIIACYTMLIASFLYYDKELSDIAEASKTDRQIYKHKIEELEKEIRLLRTDIDIIYYGIEEKELDK